MHQLVLILQIRGSYCNYFRGLDHVSKVFSKLPEEAARRNFAKVLVFFSAWLSGELAQTQAFFSWKYVKIQILVILICPGKLL